MHERNPADLVALFVACLLCAFAATCHAAEISLTLATLPTGNHRYYHRLLEESLRAAGHTVKITAVDNLPQPRIVSYVDSGKLTLHWFLQTKARDAKFVAVDHRLTQGLIGKRVMLIPKDDQLVYSNVKNLDDLKALNKTAGMGEGWFDVEVWRESGLKVVEQGGDWTQLYPMVASKKRDIDYFARGAIEIVAEAQANPALTIEPRLLLVYPRDFSFYLSKSNIALKPMIEAALAQAEKSGLQQRLMMEHFGPSVDSLNLDKRVVITLKNPTHN